MLCWPKHFHKGRNLLVFGLLFFFPPIYTTRNPNNSNSNPAGPVSSKVLLIVNFFIYKVKPRSYSMKLLDPEECVKSCRRKLFIYLFVCLLRQLYRVTKSTLTTCLRFFKRDIRLYQNWEKKRTYGLNVIKKLLERMLLSFGHQCTAPNNRSGLALEICCFFF